MLRLFSTSFRGVFRTHLNICNGVFLQKAVNYFHKKVPSQMLDWVLNMSLSLYAVIGVRVVAPKTIKEQSKLVLNILTRQSIHCD